MYADDKPDYKNISSPVTVKWSWIDSHGIHIAWFDYEFVRELPNSGIDVDLTPYLSYARFIYSYTLAALAAEIEALSNLLTHALNHPFELFHTEPPNIIPGYRAKVFNEYADKHGIGGKRFPSREEMRPEHYVNQQRINHDQAPDPFREDKPSEQWVDGIDLDSLGQ